MPKPIRIVITGVSIYDACYNSRNRWIGLSGEFKLMPKTGPPGYCAGEFDGGEGNHMTFHAVRYKKLQ